MLAAGLDLTTESLMPLERRTAKLGDQIWDGPNPIYTFARPGLVTIGLPGDDLEFMVTVVETPVPIPPKIEAYPLPNGLKKVIVTSGKATIRPASKTFIVPDSGRVTVNADTGIWLNDNLEDVTVQGIDFVGNGTKGDGCYCVSKRVKRIKFIDCSFRNFKNLVTFHHPDLNDSPESEGIQDLSFERCRLMDAAGLGLKEGHGGYFCNVDGLTITECFVEGAGWAKKERNEYVHGLYIQAGCKRVRVQNCLFNKCESVGIQARGPLRKWNDKDDGSDPGPILIGNVLDDCAIELMPNGPRAELRDNLCLAGHAHADGDGWTGIWASVGKLKQTNNLLAKGKGATARPKTVNAPFLNNPRDDAEWGYRASTGQIENSGNLARLDVTVDLSDIHKQARAGGDIKSLVAQAQARGREAVK